MRRYYILHGDKTTANGTVIATDNSSTNHGRALAMIGDPVHCTSCKTTGRIAPQGPRWASSFHGRQPALDRDMCICKCSPSPLLINSRTDMAESMTSEEVIAQGFGAWVGINQETAASASVSDELLEQYFEFFGEHQQIPEGYRYDLIDGSGPLYRSQDFSSGKTISHLGTQMRMVMWLNKSGTIRS